jgi:hypothetical protein
MPKRAVDAVNPCRGGRLVRPAVQTHRAMAWAIAAIGSAGSAWQSTRSASPSRDGRGVRPYTGKPGAIMKMNMEEY